jgi:excisionase family DNA binding protein
MRMWKGRLSDDHTTVLHAASRKDGMNILDAPRPAKLMYSVDELAELLGVDRSTIYRLASGPNPAIPHTLVGYRRRFLAADVEAYLKANRHGA